MTPKYQLAISTALVFIFLNNYIFVVVFSGILQLSEVIANDKSYQFVNKSKVEKTQYIYTHINNICNIPVVKELAY